MSDIICARDYIADCQCDGCIQKRDASERAPNALPGIIYQILRENAQLNTQVTELQQRGTELVEENRVLRRENEALRLDLAETQSLLTLHEDSFGHP